MLFVMNFLIALRDPEPEYITCYVEIFVFKISVDHLTCVDNCIRCELINCS